MRKRHTRQNKKPQTSIKAIFDNILLCENISEQLETVAQDFPPSSTVCATLTSGLLLSGINASVITCFSHQDF